ncbi:hypothetical protein H4R34_005518 [Dimargaris verticillata]|uniref:Bacterial surface antigen (D15) domain-containing protein n=1 Tax=Dimargaris verticillata TaxID=2761393 RepID=A0A9W8AWD6_9FUNG|nr:hypothetical protein H4R34_005518 [Dimargaris verticillata]
MRVEAGHDIKSAVYLSLLGDYRDNPLLSTRGYMWKLYAELAGLGGDARFIKQEGQTQGSVNLGRGFVLSASARAGLIKPLQGNAVSIADRFFLGGPTSLRGYHQFGVGPRDQSDALGGTVHWATGLSLFTPLPNVDTDMLKGHLWANAGALASVPHGGTLANTLATSLQRPTTSLGCGLVFHYSMMRLELNFALPITATIWDQAKKGWQFGLGVDFL